MSVQNGERLATKQDLADMYQGILPYLGGMPEMLANKFSKGDLYSTDEKMIGQWIDGKPLYQKTIQATLPSTYSTEGVDTIVDISDINLENVVDLRGFHTGPNVNVPLGTYDYRSDSDPRYQFKVASWVNTSTKKLMFRVYNNTNSLVNVLVYATIQYTKTTDTAISIE